jgi:hypothetical protein
MSSGRLNERKTILGEAPWYSGERRGLTVWAMVLGYEFNSQVCLKTRWIKWTTWWPKRKKIIKTAKRAKHTKKYLKKERQYWSLNSSKSRLCLSIFPTDYVEMSFGKSVSNNFVFLTNQILLFFRPLMGLGDQGQGQGAAGAFNPYSYLNALSPNQSLRLHPPPSQEYLNATAHRLQAGLADPMGFEGKSLF